MRITRVRIGSFGGIRDRDYTLGEGMTVLYGPNESGKTSTMEFIRSVLVPYGRKKNLYPARAKTDSGTLDYEEDGPHRLELSSKDVTGDAPGCLEGMDAELYRDIFAMDSRTLDDSDCITKGDIKSRFLTLPGGEGMPAAIEWSKESEKSVLGLRRSSSSELLQVEGEISKLQASIDQGKARVNEYGDLAGQLEAKEREYSRLQEASKDDIRDRDLYNKYQSNRRNYDDLASARKSRSELGTFVPVTKADIEERDRLKAALSEAQGRVSAVEEQKREAQEWLGGLDVRTVNSYGPRIDGLQGRLETYLRDRDAPAETPEPRRVTKRETNQNLLALGIVLAAAGVVLAAAVSVYAIVLTVAGVAVAALGMKGRTVQVAADGPVPRREPSEDARAFEADLSEICSALGVSPTDPSAAVSRLRDIRSAAQTVSRTEMPFIKARSEASEASNALLRFYTRFSGEEGFDSSLRKTEAAAGIDVRIAGLERAISNAGLDPSKPECPVHYEESDAQSDMGSVMQDIGQLKERMKAILDTTSLEADMDRLEELKARRSEILVRGAASVVAGWIAEDACNGAYAGVQPGVVGSADRYLKMMTGGRYSISLDPVRNEIELVSEDDRRTMSEWSSGLRAQVLLSIKLAVAREMGEGRVPVILDDVLLPFDSARKEGAVRALAQISEEMQVLMFTCDAETREIALSLEGVTVADV